MNYRPWGPLDWLQLRLRNPTWSILGVSGTEDRCLSVLKIIPSERRDAARMLRIVDPAPFDKGALDRRLDEIATEAVTLGVAKDNFAEVALLANVDSIWDQVAAFVQEAGPNVILDITSMPKWWFFPVLRRLLAEPAVKTLVVTYGSAASYGRDLSANPLPLGPLPTFGGGIERDSIEELIVGIGFAPLGLADLYGEQVERVRYLFPFPPGPPNYLRNWRFLKDLQTEIDHRNHREEDRWHVHMYDCSSVFDALERFTNGGRRTALFAPFGPKTVSLAMCLFALAVEKANRAPIPVLYTQPQRYALDYSVGTREINGVPDVRAYCLRIDGREIYALPSAHA